MGKSQLIVPAYGGCTDVKRRRGRTSPRVPDRPPRRGNLATSGDTAQPGNRQLSRRL